MKNLKNIPLQKNDCLAIETAGNAIKNEFPVETVILFGSKSRGSSDEYSDTDLLLVDTQISRSKSAKYRLKLG